MIALVEGAERQKTPNEIALNILIAGLTLIFLLAVVTLQPFSAFSRRPGGRGHGAQRRGSGFAAGLPDSDDHRRAALGHRHRRHGPRDAAQRAGHERQGRGGGGRRQFAAARQDRHHHAGQPAGGRVPARSTASPKSELADAAQLSSLADETPEGRSVVVLAKEKYGLRGRHIPEHEATFIPFSAYTRMSGVDFEGRQLRKGATEAICRFVAEQGGEVPAVLPGNERPHLAATAARRWRWPMAARLLGVIHLKDIVKGGMKERIAQLRAHGHPHRHDHGRQPADRRRHRRRSRRGRFPGAGHAQGQARIHQEGAGRRTPGRHDRRRHQRRARAGAGRRRAWP